MQDKNATKWFAKFGLIKNFSKCNETVTKRKRIYLNSLG